MVLTEQSALSICNQCIGPAGIALCSGHEGTCRWPTPQAAAGWNPCCASARSAELTMAVPGLCWVASEPDASWRRAAACRARSASTLRSAASYPSACPATSCTCNATFSMLLCSTCEHHPDEWLCVSCADILHFSRMCFSSTIRQLPQRH